MQDDKSLFKRLQTNLTDPLKLFLKEAAWLTVRRGSSLESHSDICLYSSRRGGSTLLMEALASQPRISFSDQPFSVFVASRRNLNALPIYESGQIIDPDPEEWERIHQYISRLLRIENAANAPWKLLFRPDQLRPTRIVLKITNAKAIADRIHAAFSVETILLFRHPIAQARSVERNAWQFNGKAYLRSPTYVNRFLGNGLPDFCWRIFSSGTNLERRVLDWCLENRPLLEMIDRYPDWIVLHFEDVVTDSVNIAYHLADRLKLSHPERIVVTLRRPSRSTKKASTRSTKKAIKHADTQRILSKPFADLQAHDIEATQAILDRFGITCYRADEPFPIHRASAIPS